MSSDEEETDYERHVGAVAVENNLNKLMGEVETIEGQIKNMIVILKKPLEDDVERAQIWMGAELKETLTIFDMREVFSRLKPFAIKRKEGQNWFQWIHWVFWG